MREKTKRTLDRISGRLPFNVVKSEMEQIKRTMTATDNRCNSPRTPQLSCFICRFPPLLPNKSPALKQEIDIDQI